MTPPEPAGQIEPALCVRCLAHGRRRRLTDPVSIVGMEQMGPTCYRRTVEERIAAGRHMQLDLGLDLPAPAPRRRRVAVAA